VISEKDFVGVLQRMTVASHSSQDNLALGLEPVPSKLEHRTIAFNGSEHNFWIILEVIVNKKQHQSPLLCSCKNKVAVRSQLKRCRSNNIWNIGGVCCPQPIDPLQGLHVWFLVCDACALAGPHS
jgi:hypothetical protein